MTLLNYALHYIDGILDRILEEPDTPARTTLLADVIQQRQSLINDITREELRRLRLTLDLVEWEYNEGPDVPVNEQFVRMH